MTTIQKLRDIADALQAQRDALAALVVAGDQTRINVGAALTAIEIAIVNVSRAIGVQFSSEQKARWKDR